MLITVPAVGVPLIVEVAATPHVVLDTDAAPVPAAPTRAEAGDAGIRTSATTRGSARRTGGGC